MARKYHSPFASRDAEIAKLRTEVAELRQLKHLERFSREIGSNIMIVLGNMPFDEWPAIAKTAFKYAAERQETTAHFYLERLRK